MNLVEERQHSENDIENILNLYVDKLNNILNLKKII